MKQRSQTVLTLFRLNLQMQHSSWMSVDGSYFLRCPNRDCLSMIWSESTLTGSLCLQRMQGWHGLLWWTSYYTINFVCTKSDSTVSRMAHILCTLCYTKLIICEASNYIGSMNVHVKSSLVRSLAC